MCGMKLVIEDVIISTDFYSTVSILILGSRFHFIGMEEAGRHKRAIPILFEFHCGSKTGPLLEQSRRFSGSR